MITYINGSPIILGSAGAASLGLGNINKQIQIRTSTNPSIGTVATRILPPTANIFNGLRTTLPALGAGSPLNVTDADIADRVLNSAGAAGGPYDLRKYRGMSLASGAYNNPYNTELSYGSTYAYSVQYPDGQYPVNGPLVYPLSGPYNSKDFDLYGYNQNCANRFGVPFVSPDAARGFNIDQNRGYDCKYILGLLPDAARGFQIDPCTGYSSDPFRGCLANASGGNITDPFRGLDYNPCSCCPLGTNPCRNKATAYGSGGLCGSTRYQNQPYGLSTCTQPFNTPYPSAYGIKATRGVNVVSGATDVVSGNGITNACCVPREYMSPVAYQGAGNCRACSAGVGGRR